MKLSHASTYALHALAYLASQQPPTGVVSSQEIAKARNIFPRFLLKVLQPLVEAGVLHSVRGPNGGYRLARDPSEISMLDVLEAVDGPIRGMVPPPDTEGPWTAGGRVPWTAPLDINGIVDRRLEAFCDETADVIKQQLATFKLSDLVAR